MPVFEQIRAFELIYLANHSGLFEKAEATFRRIVLGLGIGAKQRIDIDRLLDYFAELQRYEDRQTADFDKQWLDPLRDLKDEFPAPIDTTLYHLCRASGEAVVHSRVASNRDAPKQPDARSFAVLVEHDYTATFSPIE